MVELKQLQYHLNNEVYDILNSLFYNTSEVVGKIENVENINLKKYEKVVENTMDIKEMNERCRQEGKAEGIQEGIQEGKLETVVDIVKGKIDEFGEAKTYKMLVDYLSIDKELAQKAIDTVKKERESNN